MKGNLSMGERMGEWRNLQEEKKFQGDHKKPLSRTLALLVKDGTSLQLMHNLKCQDVQTRVPQQQLMNQNQLYDQY